MLLDQAAQEERHWGARRLQSIESRDNHAAINRERDKGFAALPVEGDATLNLLERQL
ncbi:MAG: hypothetical protein ABW039_11385 [Sphingobium sp.]